MRYRANTGTSLHRLLNAAGFEHTDLTFNGDPSYLAFNRPLLEASFGVERILDVPRLRARARAHPRRRPSLRLVPGV